MSVINHERCESQYYIAAHSAIRFNGNVNRILANQLYFDGILMVDMSY